MNIKKNPHRRRNKTIDGANEHIEALVSDYTEPETWTIISALDRILDVAQDSELSEEFWDSCKNPLEYLNKELGLTSIQVVVLAVLIESGTGMSWREIANYLGCSRLSLMVYTEEIEQLLTKRWMIRKRVHEIGGFFEGFVLAYGVVTALRHNRVFVPEKLDGLTEQQFVDKLESHIDRNMNDHNASFEDDEEWMLQLVKANPQLPLCQEILKFKTIHVQSLLLMVVFDYAQWEGSEDEGLRMQCIDKLYPEDFECDGMRLDLKTCNHVLIKRGYIEPKCVDGQVDNEQYVLTRETKTKLLSSYEPSRSKCTSAGRNRRSVKSSSSIKEKALYFNATEQQQIDRLASLLSVDNLPSIQQRLAEQGMRKGFACLFYGGPGTGKTETVLQIARQTGRDLVQVDIAGLRDKWVGESEKNIKEVFDQYRSLCRNSQIMPILFFNEADAIIGKRSENAEHAVDKMDNAMQNIILQEMENLDGILIATTNLTSNLDKAFERRFLYKVEFHKPDVDVKTKIWSSMLQDLSDDDARQLASHFDFSGGQIENVARKRTVDYILSGKFASLDEIEDYCRAELLDDKRQRKPVMGFNR